MIILPYKFSGYLTNHFINNALTYRSGYTYVHHMICEEKLKQNKYDQHAKSFLYQRIMSGNQLKYYVHEIKTHEVSLLQYIDVSKHCDGLLTNEFDVNDESTHNQLNSFIIGVAYGICFTFLFIR